MPSGAQFKLTETAISDTASYLSQFEIDYLKEHPNRSKNSVWGESGFGRDTYNSLVKSEDEWRQLSTVKKVAEALEQPAHLIVRLVLKEGHLMTPQEYFQIVESTESIIESVAGKLAKLGSDERLVIAAIIEVLQDTVGLQPALVELDTGGFGIMMKKLKLSFADMAKLAKERRPKRKGLGLAPSHPAGVINVAFLESISAASETGEAVDVSLPALFDLAFVFKTLPSDLLDENSPLRETLLTAERAAIDKLDGSE